MLKKSLNIGLACGLLFSLLNAETFKKGELVIVKKGFPICFNSKDDKDSINKITAGLLGFKLSATNMAKTKEFEPILTEKSARVCMIFNTDYKAYFLGEEKNKYFDFYYIYDKDDYGVVPKNALKKVENSQQTTQQKQETESPKYSFVGINDLESFPSDYKDKRVYLECKRGKVEEDREGGYEIMANCAKADHSFGFGTNNPFKIKIHTNDKKIAKKIAKSGREKKYFLGTVRKNTAQFPLAKYIFEIEEVQF
jgi:hypothetical protein